MKIQIVASKNAKNLGFKSPLRNFKIISISTPRSSSQLKVGLIVEFSAYQSFFLLILILLVHYSDVISLFTSSSELSKACHNNTEFEIKIFTKFVNMTTIFLDT